MSVGGVILGTIGAIIGGFATESPQGAMAGWSIGYALGAAAFPPKRPDLPSVQGPRLNDLRVMSADPGQPIPLTFGTCRFAGTVIWSTGLIETATTTEISSPHAAKGGGGPKPGSQTTYSYSTSAAALICEGPIDGIGRIWADEAKLVRDYIGFVGPTGVPPCTDADISAYRALADSWYDRNSGAPAGTGATLTLYRLNVNCLALPDSLGDPRPVLACGYNILGSGQETTVPPPDYGFYDPSGTA